MKRRFQFHLLTLLICQPFAAFVLYIIVRVHSNNPNPHDGSNWIATLILICSIGWFARWTEWLISHLEWRRRKKVWELREKRALERFDTYNAWRNKVRNSRPK